MNLHIANRFNYFLIIFMIITIVLLTPLLNAQNFQKVDSLELSLKFTENPKNKVEILLKLSSEFENNDPVKALNYAQEAYDISEEIDYEKGILNSMINMAMNYWSMTDYKTAMEFAVKAEELAEELSTIKELARSIYVIGIIYVELGEYDKSAECFFECLKLSEQINDKNGIGRAFSSIGSVYFEQKYYEKALEYYFNSLNIAKEINDRIGIARGLNNIAAVHIRKKDNRKANRYIKEAIEINKELGNKEWEGTNYMNLGVINIKQKNYDVALEYFQQALLIFEDLKNIIFASRCQINLGYYYLSINEIKRSQEYAIKAFEEGKKHGFKTVVHSSAELLSKIYLVKKDTLNYFKYDNVKYQMKDSLNIEKSNIELTKLELLYEFNKKEQEKRIEQQRKDFIYIIIIIILVFSIVMITLILLTRQRTKAKNALFEKKQLENEIEYKNKELAINVMSLLKKNEMLSGISDKLIKVRGEAIKEETKEALEKIALKLKRSTESEIWEEFELRFKQVHVEFYSKLLEKFPDLSPGEQRLCAFLRLNMSTKEISELTGQRTNTIEMSRYRIRKKFGIANSEINLITFLSHI